MKKRKGRRRTLVSYTTNKVRRYRVCVFLASSFYETKNLKMFGIETIKEIKLFGKFLSTAGKNSTSEKFTLTLCTDQIKKGEKSPVL